jgi:hypothetical protein
MSWTTQKNPVKLSPNIMTGQRNLTLTFAVATLAIWSIAAKTTPYTEEPTGVHEIQVSLLGQPCTLQGPFDEKTLKLIHSLGPAQIEIDPLASNTREKVRKLGESFHSSGKGIADLNPKVERSLEGYLTRQYKRLEVLGVYFDALELLEKNHKTGEFCKKISAPLHNPNLASLEKLATDMIKAPRSSPKQKELSSQLFELYNEKLDDPEKEFHRTIKQLRVQYNCFFEEPEAASED